MDRGRRICDGGVVAGGAKHTSLSRPGRFFGDVGAAFQRAGALDDDACRVHRLLHARSARFVGSLSFCGNWWMHAMVGVWFVFTLMLFVAEPLFLHRRLLGRAKVEPEATF